MKIGPYVFSIVSFPAVAGVVVHGDAVRMMVVVITAAEHGCAHLTEEEVETEWDASKQRR